MRLLLTMLFGIVVLLSTTGLPRVQHLCGGIVQSAGIWMGASGCDHEAASSHSCSAQSPLKHEQQVTKSSCCKENASEASEKKSCCTDQLDWEPSQLDLAIGDQLVLDGQVSFVVATTGYTATLPGIAEDLFLYVRPPPLWPIPQSRRLALFQVYRC